MRKERWRRGGKDREGKKWGAEGRRTAEGAGEEECVYLTHLRQLLQTTSLVPTAVPRGRYYYFIDEHTALENDIDTILYQPVVKLGFPRAHTRNRGTCPTTALPVSPRYVGFHRGRVAFAARKPRAVPIPLPRFWGMPLSSSGTV